MAFVPLVVVLVICLPWAIRNSKIMGKPAFIENSLSYNLFIGYHPEGNGEFISSIAILPLNILDDSARDSYCMQAAAHFIRSDPLEALLRIPRRAVAMLGPEDREFTYFYTNNFFGSISRPCLLLIYLLLVIPWFAVLLFAIPGMWLVPNKAATWLAVLFLAGYAGVHLVILAEPRFHLALIPVLLPFAAYGFQQRKTAFARIFGLVRRGPGLGVWISRAALLVLLGLWLAAVFERTDVLPDLFSTGGNLLRFAY